MLKHSLLQKTKHYIKKIPGARQAHFNIRLLCCPTYREDGFVTVHNSDCLSTDKFKQAYGAGLQRQPGSDLQWRTHVVIWAATHALNAEGDFVECGVNRAFFSTAIMDYINFKAMSDRQFYLFDTYCGLVEEQITEKDTAASWNEYPDVYEDVKNAFKDYDNVNVIKGVVPESLETVNISKVAYLSIDMNCAPPEQAALEYFWPKLSSGGVIVLDDFGWKGHEEQKIMAENFAAERSVEILNLPTGQGVIIKP